MIKKKIFRIPLALAAEFEKACTLMGVKEREAAEQALKDWLKKNQSQASLESYLKQRTAKPVIFQNVTLQKIQITIVRSELQRLLQVYESCQPEMKLTFLKDIQRILPSAMHLIQKTEDAELRDLIKQVENLAESQSDQ